MMTTALFDEATAKRVESMVCDVFSCTVPDIKSFGDSVSKKVVVFVLSKIYGFDKRQIGSAYKITYLFVPTVVEKVELQMLRNDVFEKKIIKVLSGLDYERKGINHYRDRIAS